jgi:hypothetical protein
LKKLEKTIYLHIGTGKTGTGALQEFFHLNSNNLAKNGILYPTNGAAGPVDRPQHSSFAVSLWANPPYWMPKTTTTPEQFFNNMLDEANNHCLNKILISSELLFFTPFEKLGQLRKIFDTVNLVVICYIRRIDNFLPSFLHQGIKAQGLTIDGNQYEKVETFPFIKNNISTVSNRLKKWFEIIPKENFVIRPYEKDQFNGGNIFSDFLDILCIRPNGDFDLPKKKFNSRLTRDALEYKRLLNWLHLDSPEKTTPFISPLLSYSAREDSSTTAEFNPDNNLLSPKIRYDAYKCNAEFYKYIAKKYLNREDGRLFYDPLPDPNERWQTYPGLRTEKADKITHFLYDHQPDLVKSLYQRVSNSQRELNGNVNEAKEILLPSFERVLGIRTLEKKKTVRKMTPTIYLHIGTAKTGTTALQNFFGENLERFAEHGYYFPKTGRVHYSHHGIAFYWGNHDAFKKRFDVKEDQLTRLSDELYTHRNKHILISSECLLMPAVDWEDFLSVFPHQNIRIILYLRRQDSFITSRYMEHVKGNQILHPPNEWLKSHYYPNEYLGILNHLSNYIRKKNIIIRAYEQQQFVGGSIFSDFCDILSIPLTNDFVISENNFNPHLDRDALEFNRLVNTVFNAQSTPYIFSGLLTQYSLKKQSEKKPSQRKHNLFPPSKCLEILNDCEKVNTKIAREYLGREDGRLFFDPLPDEDKAWEPYPGLSEETAEEIVNFLFDKNAQLTVRLYKALTEAKSDEPYLQEAKEILIPPLSKLSPQFEK